MHGLAMDSRSWDIIKHTYTDLSNALREKKVPPNLREHALFGL